MSGKTESTTTAWPPWHSLATLGFFFAFFANTLPSWEELDQHATVATFTHSLFLEDLWVLSTIRIAIASGIFLTTLCAVLGPGWLQRTPYAEGSKLKSVSYQVRGIRSLWPFTSLSWNLLGGSFLISGFVSGAIASGDDRIIQWAQNRFLLRAGLILWQVAAPNALLVATVVRYAIWSELLAKKTSTESLKVTRVLLQHNANVVVALTESALLGGLPVLQQCIGMAPIVGSLYVVFSWLVCRSWTIPEHGPQFIYHFFDTTVPGPTPTIALVVLLAVLLFFFSFFCGVSTTVLAQIPSGAAPRLAFVLLLSSCVCRFRD